jgi:hypothetical protein
MLAPGAQLSASVAPKLPFSKEEGFFFVDSDSLLVYCLPNIPVALVSAKL